MTRSEKRPSWDEYFMEIMMMVGKRGTCNRGYVGSVITKHNRILSTGYAGAPSGIEHCDDVGHEMHTVTHPDGSSSDHCIRTAHSEQNAIVGAARYGVAIEGATLYTKMMPCYTCAKMIINAGISRLVSLRDYHASSRSKDILQEAGVEVVLLNTDIQKYDL